MLSKETIAIITRAALLTSAVTLPLFTESLITINQRLTVSKLMIEYLLSNVNLSTLVTKSLLRLNQFSICTDQNIEILLNQQTHPQELTNCFEKIISDHLEEARLYNDMQINSLAPKDAWTTIFSFFDNNEKLNLKKVSTLFEQIANEPDHGNSTQNRT